MYPRISSFPDVSFRRIYCCPTIDFSFLDQPTYDAGGGGKARQQDRERGAEASGAAGPYARLHGVPQILPIKKKHQVVSFVWRSFF